MWKSSHFSIVFCGVYCCEVYLFSFFGKKIFWKLWFSKTILYICRKIAPPLALSII